MRIAVLLAILAVSPVFAAEPIYYFDLSYLHALDRGDPQQARLAWDSAHVVAAVQGIVNRDAPRLFVRFMQRPDDFWWEELRKEGQWLAGAEVVKIGSIEELLERFKDRIKGVVVYDEKLPATANLASTIAGVEDRIPIRYDEGKGAMYGKMMGKGWGDVVRVGEDTGGPPVPRSKCDAYLWAKKRYLDTGRCSDQYMAYYIDAWWLRRPGEGSLPNFTLTNHDFFIAKRAFFFDLGMWEEESPVDDPGQKPGTDLATLKKLMEQMRANAGKEIIHIGGFVPWAWKYTDHPGAGGKHGGVDSEWKYAQVISAYGGIMDADAIGLAGMANASFYQHYPLKERYPQHDRPTLEDLKKEGLIGADGKVAPNFYVMFYMGDYDSAAWLNTHVPRWWDDPARGTIPCAWAFNPNLDRRAPHAIDYARHHATKNDWFIAGDCGAGYLNPGMLSGELWDAWVKHNQEYFRRWDLSITGFIIDGHAPGMGERGMDAYMQFSPDGIIGQKMGKIGVHRGVMPYIRMSMDLDGKPAEAGRAVAALGGGKLPAFAAIRTILKSPTWHKQTMESAQAEANGQKIRFVDPYRFFMLIKAHERTR